MACDDGYGAQGHLDPARHSGHDGLALITIERTTDLDLVEPLREAAACEGFRFLSRLVTEWESGSNRFDAPGEGFWGALVEGRVVACGGLNSFGTVGRLRRFYVLPQDRRCGVGTAMATHVITCARSAFQRLVLRTDNPAADAFYVKLGFLRVDEPGVTHAMEL